MRAGPDFAADGKRQLSCQRMELGEPDDSGRRRPVAIPGSEFELPCDRVILAIGQAADLSLLPRCAELSERTADESDGEAPVYPAGDLLTNEGTVTAAIGCGRDMALMLHERFSGEKLVPGPRPPRPVVRADQIRMQHFALHHVMTETCCRLTSAGILRRGQAGLDGRRGSQALPQLRCLQQL